MLNVDNDGGGFEMISLELLSEGFSIRWVYAELRKDCDNSVFDATEKRAQFNMGIVDLVGTILDTWIKEFCKEFLPIVNFMEAPCLNNEKK